MSFYVSNFLPIWVLAVYCLCARDVEKSFVLTETRLLNDGNRVPSTALGTFVVELTNRQHVTQAVIWAIEVGYRHIDTAALYLTEDMIAAAIINVTRRGIVTREELFITTKLPFSTGTRDQVVPAVRDALARLQLEYVNMFLIHSPENVLGENNHDYLEVWRGLEDAKGMGLTKSIGVSNFNSTHINRILTNSQTVPAVNEIEVNPTFADLELVAYCQSIGIVVTGYSPFGFMVLRRFNNLTFPPAFDDPTLVKIARKYGVQTSQVVLRYQVDRNVIPIAKALQKEHIELNIDIFDFTLTADEVLAINGFDRNVKVFVIDYDGLAVLSREAYFNSRNYVIRDNLRYYYNSFNIIL